MVERVPAVTVQPVLRALRAKGFDPTKLLEALSISAAVESDPREMLDQGRAVEVWTAAAEAMGDPAFGLSIPQLLGTDRDDVGEWAFHSAPTLRRAYKRLARHRSLIHGVARLTFDYDATQGRITHRLIRGGIMPRPIADYIAAGCLFWGRQRLGTCFAPARVQLSGPAPRSLAPYEDHFGLAVEFGFDHIALTIPAAVLDARLPQPDPRLGRNVVRNVDAVCAEMAGGDNVRLRVLQGFAGALVDGLPSLEDLVRETGVPEMGIKAVLATVGGPTNLQANLQRSLRPRFAAEPRIAPSEVPFLLGLDMSTGADA